MFPFDFTNQRYDYVLSPHGTDIYGDPDDYRWDWVKGISPHWRNGGGYKEQLDQLREVLELPLLNPQSKTFPMTERRFSCPV